MPRSAAAGLISVHVGHNLSKKRAFNFPNHEIVEIHRNLAIEIGEIAFQGGLNVRPKGNAEAPVMRLRAGRRRSGSALPVALPVLQFY